MVLPGGPDWRSRPPEPQPERTPMERAGLICSTVGAAVAFFVSLALGMVVLVVGIILSAIGKSRAGLVIGVIGLAIAAYVWNDTLGDVQDELDNFRLG
jgi:hypothetical protein